MLAIEWKSMKETEIETINYLTTPCTFRHGKKKAPFLYFDVQFINIYSIINIPLNSLILLTQPINQKLLQLAHFIFPNI